MVPNFIFFLLRWTAYREALGPANPEPILLLWPGIGAEAQGARGRHWVPGRDHALLCAKQCVSFPGGQAHTLSPPLPYSLVLPEDAWDAQNRCRLFPMGLSLPEQAWLELGAGGSRDQEAGGSGDPTLPASWAGPR